MLPNQPVARIMSVQSTVTYHAQSQFKANQFYPLSRTPLGNFKTLRVGAIVIRGGTFAIATQNLLLCIGDIVRTSSDTIALIEFLIGGRLSVNRGAEYKIINDRAGSQYTTPNIGHNTVLTGGRTVIEIQTNGGVFGIKG